MKAEALLALYERVSDAPDAIARLRRFVLDLAVRGKLVEQDAGEEPASELLAAIDIRKRAHAVATGVSRARRNHDAEVEEPPFTPPANWRWCRLGRLVLSSDAGWSPKTESHPREGEAWGVLKVSAVSWGRFDPSANKQLLPDVEPPLSAVVEGGDFLISRANTAELVARSVVVHETPARLIMSDKIVRLKLIDLVDARYVCLVNNDAEHARSYYAASATGVSASMKNVSRDVILNLALPLPPLAEQHRIVAKVDELMALLDRLDAARTAREATRDRLTTSSLTRLTAPDTSPETLRTHARFALDALPALTTRGDQVKQIRQTILNLAVRGKLVEQEATDEPASNLLASLKSAKAASPDASRRRSRKPSLREQSTAHEIQLPESWELSDLGTIAVKITDGAHQTPTYVDKGVPFVSVKDFSSGRLDLTNTRKITEAEHQSLFRRCDPRRGDILLGRIGTLGKAVIVDTEEEFSLFVSVALIRFDHRFIQPQYLKYLLDSPLVEAEFDRVKIGGAMHTNKLNLGDLHTVRLSIPPLAEQHRIVAKVDELMALCDRLEAALQSTDTTRARLLEALLHEALAGHEPQAEAA